jgi:excinuclease ABC subunit C
MLTTYLGAAANASAEARASPPWYNAWATPRRSSVNGLFRREPFQQFGPCALDPEGHVRPVVGVRGKRARTLRAGVRRDVPRLPGVYGMIDPNGDLIYVGKAKSLRSRLLSYFRPNSRDDKAEKIIRDACRVVWEVAPSEFSALLRELELIRRFQPRFNVQGMPRRHRLCYVVVGRRPAPYAYVVTKPPRSALGCFGPFPGLGRTREAVRRLNDWYRLRDCPQAQTMVFADQAELFPADRTPGCLRHDIGHCLAPCAAACSRKDYAFHVQAALDFLRGHDVTPLEQLDRAMTEAAAALEFERAAILRDRLDALDWLNTHLERLRQAVTHSFVYPVEGHDGTTMHYLIRHGIVRAAVPAVTDEVLDAVYRGNAAGPPGLDEIDSVLLVAGWFRRNRSERKRVVDLVAARARVG